MTDRKIDFCCADGIARIVIDDAVHHNVVGVQFTQEFARAVVPTAPGAGGVRECEPP